MSGNPDVTIFGILLLVVLCFPFYSFYYFISLHFDLVCWTTSSAFKTVVSCHIVLLSYLIHILFSLITWFVANWRLWRLANELRQITGKSGNWINVALAAEKSRVSPHPIGRDKLFEVCNERRCCHRYGSVCDKARHSLS